MNFLPYVPDQHDLFGVYIFWHCRVLFPVRSERIFRVNIISNLKYYLKPHELGWIYLQEVLSRLQQSCRKDDLCGMGPNIPQKRLLEQLCEREWEQSKVYNFLVWCIPNSSKCGSALGIYLIHLFILNIYKHCCISFIQVWKSEGEIERISWKLFLLSWSLSSPLLPFFKEYPMQASAQAR